MNEITQNHIYSIEEFNQMEQKLLMQLKMIRAMADYVRKELAEQWTNEEIIEYFTQKASELK